MKIVLTIIVVLIIEAAAVVGFVYSGIYDVSATTPDQPLLARGLHELSDHSVAARLSAITVPSGLDTPENVQAGGQRFAENCVVCHGGPGLKATTIAMGLNPRPPSLFRASRKPDMAEEFQFIKHGVKMTGMPGFAASFSDDQIWQVVAFLGKAPGMSAADFNTVTGRSGEAAPSAPGK